MRNVQVDSAKLLGFRFGSQAAGAIIGDKMINIAIKIGAKISVKRP